MQSAEYAFFSLGCLIAIAGAGSKNSMSKLLGMASAGLIVFGFILGFIFVCAAVNDGAKNIPDDPPDGVTNTFNRYLAAMWFKFVGELFLILFLAVAMVMPDPTTSSDDAMEPAVEGATYPVEGPKDDV